VKEEDIKNSSRKRRKVRHRNARVPFTREETQILETYFCDEHYLDERTTKEIADRLQMTPIRVSLF
jgi:DNA-directed RNA polymerase specialized sigma subunit